MCVDGYGKKNPPFFVPCSDYSPIDEKERDGEDDLDARPGEVAPVADVGEAEALHQLVQVLHVLPRHRVHVLPPQRVLHDQLVELLYLVPRRERPEGKKENNRDCFLPFYWLFREQPQEMQFSKCIFKPSRLPSPTPKIMKNGRQVGVMAD